MPRCETGACPCDPLNPRKVALNTFLPAIFGLPLFYGGNTYVNPAPMLVCRGSPTFRLPVQWQANRLPTPSRCKYDPNASARCGPENFRCKPPMTACTRSSPRTSLAHWTMFSTPEWPQPMKTIRPCSLFEASAGTRQFGFAVWDLRQLAHADSIQNEPGNSDLPTLILAGEL